MSKKKNKVRADPGIRERSKEKTVTSWLCSQDAYDILTCRGYTNLAHNPEIISGVDTIAKLIGSMTIHLMRNTENGDERIKNELSRMVDITPCDSMTRSSFVQWIIKAMYLSGDGNAIVYPEFSQGYLRGLRPIPPAMVSYIPENIWDYTVSINGARYDPDQILHFVLSPNVDYPWKGEGVTVQLKDVANNLKQAAATEKGFMSSKWKPSIIVKVDAMIDEFSSPAGRKKLLSEYIETSEAGEPWVIPAEQFAVEQIKPLSLNDLAIADVVTLGKKTVAAILGIPAFVLGVGDFNREEWNNFINSRIMPIAQMIEQELTKKLLYSPDYYFRFNPRSLYNYDLKDIAAIADDQYVRGLMTGNEVRSWISLPPLEGLDELVILENYIPRGMIGEQKKLIQNQDE